jgi:hypothetical protein
MGAPKMSLGVPNADPKCTCHHIALGLAVTEARDWNRACPEHGTHSAWYRDGGKAYFEARRAYSIEIQRLAREARRTGVGGVVPAPPRFEDFQPKGR